jgi:hypothetical protein
MTTNRFVSIFDLRDLKTEPDALLKAFSRVSLGTAKITTYKSRKALETFCRDGSIHHALVKTPVHRNMLVNRNTQYPE